MIAELLVLDMEPKPESLWWTSTHKDEDGRTPKVGSGGKSLDFPLVEVFDLLFRVPSVLAHVQDLQHCFLSTSTSDVKKLKEGYERVKKGKN